jgi:hypothetical protein
MVRICLLVVPVLLLGPSAFADGPRSPVVAVFLMESKASPLTADETAGLTDYMAARLGEAGQFQIIPRDEIKKRLTAAKADTYKDCYDTSCQIEVGKELAAEFSISSTIGKVGKQCLISASVWDLRRSTQIRSATARQVCDVDKLVVAVEQVTVQLAEAMTDASTMYAAALAPDKQPEPVKEPEPAKEPEPVTEPEPARQPAPDGAGAAEPELAGGEKAFDQPRVYITLGMLGLEHVYVGGLSLETTEVFGLGFLADFDFRIAGSFMLGLTFDVQDFMDGWDTATDYGFGLRVGGLIQIGESLVLVPFGRFALKATAYGDCGIYSCPDNQYGVFIGAGFGVKYMFLRWLGLAADVLLGVYTYPDESDLSFVNLGFDLGLVLAF